MEIEIGMNVIGGSTAPVNIGNVLGKMIVVSLKPLDVALGTFTIAIRTELLSFEECEEPQLKRKRDADDDEVGEPIAKRNLNYGHRDYVMHGGESNPGPTILSKLAGAAVDTGVKAAKFVFSKLFPTFDDWISRVMRDLKRYGKVMAQLLRVYTSMVDCVSTFLYRLAAITSLDLYSRLIVFILNVYDIHQTIAVDFGIELNPIEAAAFAQAGPLETFAMATFLSTMLPKSLHSLIKDIPTFSNFKILDDATWVFDAFSFIVSLPKRMCELILPRTEKTNVVFSFFDSVEDFLPFNALSKHHYALKMVLDEYMKKQSRVGDPDFQTRVCETRIVYERYKRKFLEDRKELPSYMLDHDKRFRALCSKVDYMRSNRRVEPVACVFYGPAGLGKTTLMNKMVAGYEKQNSVYTHKSQKDKDFYDMYDNEDVHVVDDIGQEGAWQWAGLIGQVSTTKCPLICAEADKKGTKFFTSKLMFMSTNRIHITLTADCGIGDISALHRRLTVFNFEKVQFNKGVYKGSVVVQMYNLARREFQDVMSFDAVEGKFNLGDMALYINQLVLERAEQFAASEANTEDFGMLPVARAQSLFNDVKLPIVSVCNYFAGLFRHIDEFDMEAIGKQKVDRVMVAAMTGFAGLFVYGVYYCFNLFFEKATCKAADASLQYSARKRTRVSIRSATAQSMEDLFRPRQEEIFIPQLQRVKEQTVVVEANFVRNKRNVTTFFSSLIGGRYLTAPMHALNLDVGESVFLTVYRSPTSRYYDKVESIVKYTSFKDDVAVLELPLMLPKYFKQINLLNDTNVTDLVLCTPAGLLEIDARLTELDCRVSYKQFETNYTGVLITESSILYDEQVDGACGSPLFTKDGALIGHHVAAVVGDRLYGCSKIFSPRTAEKIKELFDEKVDYAVEASRSVVDGSIVKIHDRVYQHVASKSKYEPSLMYGVFPEVRAPANLSVFGRDTVKEFSKKSYQPVAPLDGNALDYAEQYLEELAPEAMTLESEREVVLGNADIGRIDPDSSVGYGTKGTKRDHLDYDNGRIGPEMKRQAQKFCKEVCDGTFKFDTYYAESLKDELKDAPKVNKPRVFKAGPLVLTLMYRFFFGGIMARMSKDRLKNGIMVGINPLSSQWDDFARVMLKFSRRFFDGDWRFWDGGMLSQMQQRANKALKKRIFRRSDRSKFNAIFGTNLTGEEYEMVFDMMLQLLWTTPTVTLDEAFITTHSMPSGCAVTAFFNSFINKGYGAYVFFVLYVRKFGQFPHANMYAEKVMDCVYGDDKLTAVKDDVASWYNGRSFSEVAREMGLDFTPADKGEWTYETRAIFDCSFLKRGFYIHPKIGRVVAPLDRVSMEGTLNFVSDGFRNDELSSIKVLNFQREAYLHFADYEEAMQRVGDYADAKGVVVKLLSQDYLTKLYHDGGYASFLELN